MTHTQCSHVFNQNNLSTHLESVNPASTRWNLLSQSTKRPCFQARWSCSNTATRLRNLSVTSITLFSTQVFNENGFLARNVQQMWRQQSSGKLLFSSCLELRVQGSHWGDTEGIYGLWICTIVMLMWSDASDDPQSGIIFSEPAPRLRWIHTSPGDAKTESEDY